MRKARRLASPSRWRELAARGDRAWGECRSRGASYYKVALDLEKGRTYCACPVTEPLCPHRQALVFLLTEQSEAFHQPGECPDWVETRLRQGKVGRDASEKERSRDRNRELRLQRMREGAADLREWLLDLVRQGTAAAYAQPPGYWEDMAARLVDAKMGSVASRLRGIPSLLEDPSWPERLTGELGWLYRLTKAWEQMEELSETEQWDLLRASGLNLRKEEVLAGEQLEGLWRVWSVRFREEEQLRSRKVWLQENSSGRFALLLDYAWGEKAAFEGNWSEGESGKARLAFYPSAYPLRAVIHSRETESRFSWEGPADAHAQAGLEPLRQAAAQAWAINPWMHSLPFLLSGGVPEQTAGTWTWRDEAGLCLPLSLNGESGWRLMALRARDTLVLFGEYDGFALEPHTVLAGREWIAL